MRGGGTTVLVRTGLVVFLGSSTPENQVQVLASTSPIFRNTTAQAQHRHKKNVENTNYGEDVDYILDLKVKEAKVDEAKSKVLEGGNSNRSLQSIDQENPNADGVDENQDPSAMAESTKLLQDAIAAGFQR